MSAPQSICKTTSFLQDREGNALTEFALVVPSIITIVLLLMEMGNFFWVKNSLDHAARETARFAITQGPWSGNWPGSEAALQTSMESVANTHISGAGLRTASATPTAVVSTANRTLSITLSYNFTPLVVPAKLIPATTITTTAAMDIQRP